MRSTIKVVLFGFLLSACVHVGFAPSKQGYVPGALTPPDQIEVYRTEKPQGSILEIGSIHFPGGSGNLENAIEKMKTEASKRGGNAIIDLQIIPTGVVGTVVRITKK